MVDSLVHSSSLLENVDLPAVGDWPTLQTALVEAAFLFGIPGKSSKKQPDPLSWSLPENAAHPARMKLLALVAHGAETAGKRRKALQALQSFLDPSRQHEVNAWEALFWLRVLISRSSWFEPAVGMELLTHLHTQVNDGTNFTPHGHPVVLQQLAVELPWMLGLSCPDATTQERLLHSARKCLVLLGESYVDDTGLPFDNFLPELPELLASWTRCSQIAQLAKQPLFEKYEAHRFTTVLRQVLRFTHGTGRGAFRGSADSIWPWIEQAAALANDRVSKALLQSLQQDSRVPRVKPTPAVEYSWCSAPRKLAVLKTEPIRLAPTLFVDFHEPDLRLELDSPTALLAGTWRNELVVNGRTLTCSQDWEDVLWYEDEDVVYLELETWLEDTWHLQRHFALSKDGSFLFLADAIVGEEEASLQYRSVLPLANGISFTPETATHEGWLQAGKDRWLALPLGCPEWRSEPSAYQLEATEQGLCYSGCRTGRTLYTPLLLMLHPSRGKPEYTWRKLTVAEQLEIQPADAAVAYRAQLGELQWVHYRALASKGNRTFLGKNIVNEFFLGRFHRNGSIDSIMEVE